MYFSAMYILSWYRKALYSARRPHCVKQQWDGKTSLHTHTAVARLPGVS